MIKKIIDFLTGAKLKDMRTNNPCQLARDGKYCPYANCYVKCTDCNYFDGGKE